MNKANEIMVSRTCEQAFNTVAAMVSGKKEIDSQVLIQTIQNQKAMIDIMVASIERMEAEAE